MPADTFPDYYAILQVHPSAEPEVIEVAYRQLMKKYHPDVLSPELRQDMEILRRVQAINMAYDVLSDPERRTAYDEAYTCREQPPADDPPPDVETLILRVRCARMLKTFRMLIGRKKGSNGLYRALGFEPLDPEPAPELTGQDVPALPAPQPSGDFLARALDWLMPRKKPESQPKAGPSPRFPRGEELRAMFTESGAVNFGQIDWGGWHCPACNGEHVHPNGVTATWCRCSKCMGIYCGGEITNTPSGEMTRCPWCGRRARITLTVRPGDPADLPVKGEAGPSSPGEGKRRRLPPDETPRLQ